jgi:glycosyltransferase involved in cell wall biosynthesis
VIKVLFVNPGGDAAGGAERSLALLIKGLQKRGLEIGVVTLMAGNAVDAFSSAGAAILANGLRDSLGSARRHDASIKFAIGAARMVLPAINAARTVRELARQFGADLIHTNGLRAHMLTPLLAKEYPVVWSLRDVPSGWLARRLTRRAARAASVITAPSSFAARFTSRSGRPMYVIPNPVERPTVLDVEVARNRLGIPHGRAVVAVAGHMHPVHGHHIAVAAWLMFAAPRPLLLLAGGDLYGDASKRYLRALRSSIGRMGLEDDVMLLGLVDAADLYAACDLIVHPALHPEGFGRVMAEAQLAGLPVIATSIGAARELIDDGRSGLLVPPGDASALADAVRRVLEDPILSERLRAGGLAAGERYRPEAHAAAMESVYRAVTA